MHEELWVEVREIVHEAVIKSIPKKKKCKKTKWLSEEALQIVKRKAKGKREKERYTHLNGEFQRIARRDKKAFLSDQCKEIEENRMGKTKNLLWRRQWQLTPVLLPGKSHGWRFVTLYRRQGSRPSPWKRNEKNQNGCLGRPSNSCEKKRS